MIRRLMDECLPPAVRGNYYFMYPFYRVWFAGSPDMDSIINFKEVVHSMSDEEFANFYGEVQGRGNLRPTDCSQESLSWVIDRLSRDPQSRTLLDVGCGRGYCVSRFAELGWAVTGCDVQSKHIPPDIARFAYGSAEELSFADKSFDVVTCFHTLEHVRQLHKAFAELKRVAKRHIFIIVPCQRYYKYTLDLHLHFFYSPAYFSLLFDLDRFECDLIGGDIVYHGYFSDDQPTAGR
jgi:SAM-dependent methyltransferase